MSEITKPLMTEEMGARLAAAIENIPYIAGPQGERGVKGDPGLGFPVGGAKGQLLIKKSANNYDTEWGNFDYNNLLNKPDLATVALTGSYNDLSNLPIIQNILYGTSKPSNSIGKNGDLFIVI